MERWLRPTETNCGRSGVRRVAGATISGRGLMGWNGPRTLDVTLPEELRDKARGVRIVTCRYFGEGRQQKVKTRREVRQMERWERMGKVISEAADKHAEKVRAGDAPKPDPEKVMLAVFPPDLVCAQVVRALDGERLQDDDREDWVDDTHADVVRHVALEVMRESDGRARDGGPSRGKAPAVRPIPRRVRRPVTTSGRSRRQKPTS